MTDESDAKTENATKGSGAAHNLRDIIERTFMAGMGAAALTKDRLQDLVEELVRVGQLNADEGREMVDRLISRTRDDARSMLKKVENAAPSVYREQLSALQNQVADQELRISQLEHRVQLLESAADRQS
jgi:polyhydroxyalkanoate synthesis regulator phasin